MEAGRLLSDHPDHERWLKRAGGDDPDRMAFIEASTWPDDIRRDKRFYTADFDAPTPILAGFADMERHRNWHYVNRPLNGDTHQTPLSGLLDKQLEVLAKTLGSSRISADKRSYALPWLIHLVGDAHQPLHTSVRLDAAGKWDKLGNELKVYNPFNSRKPSSTLHAFWDDLPGPPWLRDDRLDAVCWTLSSTYSRPQHASSSNTWIDESWQIARASGYPTSDESIPIIDESFHENSREIANRRVAEAGYRLAELLNQLFKPYR